MKHWKWICLAIAATLLVCVFGALAEPEDTLYLPADLKVIDEQAFMDAESLGKVVIPEGVTEIGSKAFANSGTREVVFPASLTYIAEDAFEGCGNLTVSVPENCYAYAWCFRHGYVDAPATTPAEDFTYETLNGLYAKITGYTGDSGIVIIPDEIDDYIIQEIGNNAFKNNKDILYVKVPDTVIRIGSEAFRRCTALKSIDIGNSVEEIGNEAFTYCNSLTGVDFPDTLTVTGHNLFSYCTNLEYFDYPLNWAQAGANTILGCNKITELNIPEGVKKVPKKAFKNCSNITSIKFPSTVIEIEEDAFSCCDGLTKVIIPGNISTLNGFSECSNLSEIELSGGIHTIGNYAFEKCVALTSIEIPDSVTIIGNHAFSECSSLEEVKLYDGMERVGKHAFSDCTNLSSIVLPDSVYAIGCNAFENCEVLSEFHYPTNLSLIIAEYGEWDSSYDAFSSGGQVFKGCKKLKRIEVPEGVEEIPSNMFDRCDYLRQVSLPSTLKIIGNSAFAECVAITSIDFPQNMERIGKHAFRGCTYLTEAMLPDSIIAIGCGAFEDCENIIAFHYPVNLSVLIREYGDWDRSYDALGSGGKIFTGCKKLLSIDIPEGVRSIPDSFFQDSDYLKTVGIPSSLEEIGEECFIDCTALEKIYLGYTVTTIGNDAFSDCPALTIWTEYGAYALQYAKDNDIPYYYLTPDGVNSPFGTLYKGDAYSIYGYARSSVNLTEITATIWDSDGENIIQQVSVNPATANYNLSGTVNTSLLFGNLELGSYRYTLTAKTDVSEEVWANNSFTVVPPPLRMYVSGMNVPDGLVAKDQAFAYSGLVQANYPITNITAIVTNTYGVVQYSYSQNPDGLTFNLNNFDSALPVANLGGGGYSFTVSATANGETRTVIQTAFEMVDSTEQLSDADTAKILAFARQSSKREIFNCNTYINAVLGDMDALQITIMALNSPFKWTSGYLQGLIEGNPGINEYAVDLYRKEIVDSIASMNNVADMIPKTTEQKTKEFFIELGMDWNMDILDEMKKDIDNLSEEGLSCLSTIVDGLKDLKTVHKAFNMSADLAEQFAKLYLTAENGMLVIDSIAENSSLYSNNQEFQKAVLITKREYAAFVNQEVNELIVFIGTEFERLTGETFSKTAVNLILGAITEINPINYGLKIGMKLTMLDDVAKDYQSFMIQAQVQMSANDAYKNAFDKVAGGDTSAKAVSTLKVMYSYAGQTTKTLCNTILDFDFLYGNTYPGLYTMINMIENSSITD